MALRPLLCAVTLSITAVTAAQTSSPAPTTVLHDVRIIDGTGAAPREHMTVLLSNGRIAKICNKDCNVPPDAIDAKLNGATVMPSLISAHSHLALLNDESNFDTTQYTEANVVRQLQQYERYGVTTILSLGMNKDIVYSIRAHQRAGQFDGATLLTVGRGIGVPDGMPPMSAPADQLYTPHTPEEARHDVDETADNHADFIKIWVDSNHGKLPLMSADISNAVITEAHKRGLRVAAHVHDLEDARRLVNQGVDMLAHSIRDKGVDAKFIALAKKKHIWYLPTLTVDESFFVFADQPDLLDSPFLQHAIPAATLTKLKSADYRNKTLADPATAAHRADFAIASKNLLKLYKAGVQIGFGTDSGAVIGRVPGYAEHRELALMVSAGLTPLQAIACATSHNASLLHRTDDGVIKEGNRADLLVVNGNPATSILDTTHIAAVFHEGIRNQHIGE